MGAGLNGEAYAAVRKRDADRALTKQGQKSQAYCDELRSKLVVVKYHQPIAPGGDLHQEIALLTRTITAMNSRYTYRINHYYDGEAQWLALPFVAGGDLEAFAEQFPPALTLGFQWHVALQLSKVLLFLHFGVDGDSDAGDSDGGWPWVCHGDIFTKNILLRPNPGSNSQYPDLVLADFGTAKDYDNPDHVGLSLEIMVDCQISDLVDMGNVLHQLSNLHVEDRMKHAHVASPRSRGAATFDCIVTADSDHERSRDSLRSITAKLQDFHLYNNDINEEEDLLRAIVEVAGFELMKHEMPLAPDAARFLSKTRISDEQLLAATSDIRAFGT